MSLRLRLTLLYSTFMGGILLIFGAAVFILVNVILLNQVDTTLAGDVHRRSHVTKGNSVSDMNVIRLTPLGMNSNVNVQVWRKDAKTIGPSPSNCQVVSSH